MNPFTAFLKRQALKKYAQTLPRKLAHDYGASEFYTPAQIKTAVAKLKLNPDYIVFANAMFLPIEQFTATNPDMAYEQARTEFRRYRSSNPTSTGSEPEYSAISQSIGYDASQGGGFGF